MVGVGGGVGTVLGPWPAWPGTACRRLNVPFDAGAGTAGPVAGRPASLLPAVPLFCSPVFCSLCWGGVVGGGGVSPEYKNISYKKSFVCGFNFPSLVFKPSKNMNEATQAIDLRDVITNHLKLDRRSLLWLSDKIGSREGLSYGNLYGCLVQKIISLNQYKLDAINKALGTTYQLDSE